MSQSVFNEKTKFFIQRARVLFVPECQDEHPHIQLELFLDRTVFVDALCCDMNDRTPIGSRFCSG
jgi:hypothetical protein